MHVKVQVNQLEEFDILTYKLVIVLVPIDSDDIIVKHLLSTLEKMLNIPILKQH